MCGKAIDLAGQRFGNWTVIERTTDRIYFDEQRSGGKPEAMWLCQCECGTVKAVSGANLRHGKTKSCGCVSSRPTNYIDLTGCKFGRLTVLGIEGKRNSGELKWLCKCDCGSESVALTSNLTRGNSTSCGCVNAEIRKKRHEEAECRKQARKEDAKQATINKRHDSFKAKFVDKYGDSFEYIGGYPGLVITIKCKTCGYNRTRNRKKIFGDSNISCSECGNNRKGVQEASCEKCGAIFMQYGEQHTLCKNCHNEVIRIRNRARDSINRRLRESRARENGKVDYSITLSKLIKRDNHICKLCGRMVNEDDYVYIGDTFVAGNDYPSVDHIKPLSKGGVHQWNNVQLAHRLCNSLKKDIEF